MAWPASGSHLLSTWDRLVRNRLVADREDIDRLDGFVFDVRKYGATGNGTTNDTIAINATVDAAYTAAEDDTGATIRLTPGSEHVIARRVPGSSTLGMVRLRRGQEFDGAGAILKLSEALTTTAGMIVNRRPDHADDIGTATTQTTITADLAAGDDQMTVASTTGFLADDWVLVKFGDNPYDNAQTIDHLFAKIVSIDSATTMTIDRPVQRALDVSEVIGANNKSVRLLIEEPGPVNIHDMSLLNTQVGTARSEGSVILYHSKGAVIENVVATNPGPGLYFAYPEDLLLRNIHIPSSLRPGPASTSHGRGIGMWNARNVRGENIRIEHFEDAAIFLESYCRNVEIDGLHILNTYADRDNASEPLLMVVQGSQVHIRNLLVEGNGGCVLTSSGGTVNEITIENLSIQTATAMLGVEISRVFGTFTVGDIVFHERDIRRRTVYIELAPNMLNVNVPLPIGLYRRAWIYASTTTGVTSAVLRAASTNYPTTTLVADGRVELAGVGNFGSSYARNALTTTGVTKFCRINTDGTVPAGAYLVVEAEYWPCDATTALPSPNDGARGLPALYTGNASAYTPTNVTTDRAFDADTVTTAELADVVGTLIQDLQRRRILG